MQLMVDYLQEELESCNDEGAGIVLNNAIEKARGFRCKEQHFVIDFSVNNALDISDSIDFYTEAERLFNEKYKE